MKLDDEIQRLKEGLYITERQLLPPDDYCVELLARGDRTGAIRYCKEMYNECLREPGRAARAEEYLAFVDQLQTEPRPDDPSLGI
jgi:hypothetical protein